MTFVLALLLTLAEGQTSLHMGDKTYQTIEDCEQARVAKVEQLRARGVPADAAAPFCAVRRQESA